jgi:hypothetical protein
MNSFRGHFSAYLGSPNSLQGNVPVLFMKMNYSFFKGVLLLQEIYLFPCSCLFLTYSHQLFAKLMVSK